ncbi:MAG TPA: hypothetical protein VJ654_17070 [Noviherbaspirillum sp.]|nr:hypothetical protein [Noviherbaspirillum sp.]
MAGFDFEVEVEVILLRLGAFAGDRYEWQLETRAGVLDIQVHHTWIQTCFMNPRDAASIVRYGEIDPLTGRWDWHFESPLDMDDLNAIEQVLSGLLDVEREKSLPFMEVLLRKFNAELRAKGTKIRFRKPSDCGELAETSPMGSSSASAPNSTSQPLPKLTIPPPGAPLPPDHPFTQPAMDFGIKRSARPLVPIRPPDLEDIAFEILRHARYKKR